MVGEGGKGKRPENEGLEAVGLGDWAGMRERTELIIETERWLIKRTDRWLIMIIIKMPMKH